MSLRRAALSASARAGLNLRQAASRARQVWRKQCTRRASTRASDEQRSARVPVRAARDPTTSPDTIDQPLITLMGQGDGVVPL